MPPPATLVVTENIIKSITREVPRCLFQQLNYDATGKAYYDIFNRLYAYLTSSVTDRERRADGQSRGKCRV